MTISCLADNLREIYLAEHDENVEKILLTADFSGKKIYHASFGWGRIWRWFYSAVKLVSGVDLEMKKLSSAMEKTHTLFQEHFASTQVHLNSYKSYLYKRSIGVAVEEEKYHEARKKISSWNRATAPFLQAFSCERGSKVSEYTAKFFPEKLNDNRDQDLQSLTVIQDLIDFEGYLHGPLPLESFKKLACGVKLKDKELSEMSEWIYHYSKEDSPITIRSFHLALKAFVESMRKEWLRSSLNGDENSMPNLLRLEMALKDLGLNIFTQKDPVHLKWRSHLKPGSVLNYSGGLLTLDEQLGKKRCDEDNNLIFSVKEDPYKVIVIGINQAILHMKRDIDDKKGWGLHTAECFEIAFSGDYAIYEKLEGSLEKLTWVTDKGWVEHQDLDHLTPVQEMLKWMVNEKLTPYHLDLKYLRYDRKGRLKYEKVCLPKEFDYEALENFVFQCSKGNKTVFCHLMDFSGLYAHSYRTFYFKMVQSALNGEKMNTKNISTFEGVLDSRVVDKGDLLYKQVEEMKENCLKNILSNHLVSDIKKLEQLIRSEIRNYYIKLKLSGTLWPTMEQEITSKIIEEEKLKFRDDR